jgi:hypothetical protein
MKNLSDSVRAYATFSTFGLYYIVDRILDVAVSADTWSVVDTSVYMPVWNAVESHVLSFIYAKLT